MDNQPILVLRNAKLMYLLTAVLVAALITSMFLLGFYMGKSSNGNIVIKSGENDLNPANALNHASKDSLLVPEENYSVSYDVLPSQFTNLSVNANTPNYSSLEKPYTLVHAVRAKNKPYYEDTNLLTSDIYIYASSEEDCMPEGEEIESFTKLPKDSAWKYEKMNENIDKDTNEKVVVREYLTNPQGNEKMCLQAIVVIKTSEDTTLKPYDSSTLSDSIKTFVNSIEVSSLPK